MNITYRIFKQNRYLFNLEIEPNYIPQPMRKERTEKYDCTVELLTKLGFLGQFSVQENGRMKRGFKDGLELRRAYFNVTDVKLA